MARGGAARVAAAAAIRSLAGGWGQQSVAPQVDEPNPCPVLVISVHATKNNQDILVFCGVGEKSV
jgi:hypothetical protein